MTRKQWIQKIVFGLLGAGSLFVLFLWMKHIHPLAFFLFFVLEIAATSGIIAFHPDKCPILFKLSITALALIALVEAGIIVWEHTGMGERIESVDQLIDIIQNAEWGLLVFFGLTLLQVVVLPVPAWMTVMAGAAIYGSTVSFLVSSAGTVLGSFICFFLGRKFGKKIVYWMIGQEKAEQYSKLIFDKGKLAFVVMMVFPFFPDDMLCMTAGLTNMKFRFFAVSVSLTRPVMLAFYSYFGMRIPFTTWWGILIWIGIFAVMVAAMVPAKRFIERYKQKKNEPKPLVEIQKTPPSDKEDGE
ncbi:MAG: TVP38/TMEM64 family protein [Clostridiales bacterium]|nr:TVP38/TMEM64 family protein [Clostridiales bacterium]